MRPQNDAQRAYDTNAGPAFREWRMSLPQKDPRAQQMEVARRVNCKAPYLSIIEKGRATCTANMRARLAQAVGVHVRDIWPDAPELSGPSNEGGSAVRQDGKP